MNAGTHGVDLDVQAEAHNHNTPPSEDAAMGAANPGYGNNPPVAGDPIAIVSSDDGEKYPVYGNHFDGSDQ